MSGSASLEGAPSGQRGERSPVTRAVTLAIAGFFVLVLVPYAFIRLGGGLDSWMGWAPLVQLPFNWVAGVALGVAGWALGLWAVYVQVDQGRGTPVPLVPTQRLLTGGPYKYCRNPMTLGTIAMYKGVAVFTGSWGVTVMVVLFLAALLLYIRFIEEKELAARFGAEYEEYRRRTAFIIPGIL